MGNEHIFFAPNHIFFSFGSDCSQTRHMTQRDVCTRTQTHSHTRTLVMDCSTCTECWRSKRGGKVCSAAWPEEAARPDVRPTYEAMWGGGEGVFCPCAVTVSHTTNPHPRPFLVLSPSCRPPPIHPSPCPLVNARSRRQGSSLWWGHPGHTLATAVLNGFLRGYNQRRQAGQRLGQLEEGMLQRTEKMEEYI